MIRRIRARDVRTNDQLLTEAGSVRVFAVEQDLTYVQITTTHATFTFDRSCWVRVDRREVSNA